MDFHKWNSSNISNVSSPDYCVKFQNAYCCIMEAGTCGIYDCIDNSEITEEKWMMHWLERCELNMIGFYRYSPAPLLP